VSEKLPKVVVILGPTASGKTALAVALARAISGEVVSADSRQVYRGLDIGSGKVTKKEMRGVPHHLLDVVSPKKTYTASDYVTAGREAVSEILSRGKVPIIAGGTGFYIDALVGTIALSDVPPNTKLRAALKNRPLRYLQSKLKQLDPTRYTTIDTKNPVRLIRAIEIAKARGKTAPRRPVPIYEVMYIGIDIPNDVLKAHIKKRLLARIRSGMLSEAKRIKKAGVSWKRMEELGLEYRYMARHLRDMISKAEMISELEKQIHAYAKRQKTWFKKNRNIHWVSKSQFSGVPILVKKFLSR
jgi:tRNA dimethylallyltransferase